MLAIRAHPWAYCLWLWDVRVRCHLETPLNLSPRDLSLIVMCRSVIAYRKPKAITRSPPVNRSAGFTGIMLRHSGVFSFVRIRYRMGVAFSEAFPSFS